MSGVLREGGVVSRLWASDQDADARCGHAPGEDQVQDERGLCVPVSPLAWLSRIPEPVGEDWHRDGHVASLSAERRVALDSLRHRPPVDLADHHVLDERLRRPHSQHRKPHQRTTQQQHAQATATARTGRHRCDDTRGARRRTGTRSNRRSGRSRVVSATDGKSCHRWLVCGMCRR